MDGRDTADSKQFYKVRNPIRILLTVVLLVGCLVNYFNIFDRSTEKIMLIFLLLLGLGLGLETLLHRKYYEEHSGSGNVNTFMFATFLVSALVFFQLVNFF